MLVFILHALQCSIEIEKWEKFCFKFSTQQNIKAVQKDHKQQAYSDDDLASKGTWHQP